MEGKAAETVSPVIGQLVLALAKTYHWAGLYGTNHPILAKRVGEFHAALLARLSHEPEGRLLLGIARDKVLYRSEFFGEGQELVARLMESLYLRRVATLGFDPDVTPEDLLSLFRYLHESPEHDSALSPERFLVERGVAGISLSPINYKELLSRKLAESQETAPSEDREKELWRLLLTADTTDKEEEAKVMEELLQTPTLFSAILQRSREAEDRKEPAAGDAPMSAGMVKKVVGRLSQFVRNLPKDRKKDLLSSLDTGLGRPDAGGGEKSEEDDLLLARSLAEGHTDEEFLDLVATLVSIERRGGERLRRAFAILAGERDAKNTLLESVKEKVRETRRVKDYYAQKTWEAVEKLLLSRDEEKYLQEDHRLFLEEISSLRKPFFARIERKMPDGLEIQKEFGEQPIRDRTLRILLEFMRNETQEEVFFDLLEDVRKAIPNLISLKDFRLLHTILSSLDALSTTTNKEWQGRVRGALLETDFPQIVELYLTGGISPEDQETIQDIMARFPDAAVQPLLDRLLLEPEANRRRSLIRLLVTLGPVVVPDALERLSHPKWYYVRNLCTVLGDVGDRRAVDPLMLAASHPDTRVRREAIQAIGKLGAPEAVPGLGKVLLEEKFFSSAKEDLVRIDAANALYRIGGTEAIAFLHRGKGVRRKAVGSHCNGLLHSLMGAP